jgi:hypothetical protein
LISYDTEIEGVKHYGHRGHRFVMTDDTGKKILICNIYAPNGFDDSKANFFHEVFQDLMDWDGDIILGGDFNLTLTDKDRHCRGTTPAEARIANLVTAYVTDTNLVDCWYKKQGFTWRKGKIMSKLDRIYVRLTDYALEEIETNWTFSQSDHAGVIVSVAHQNATRHKNDHVKLDNAVVLNPETLAELKEYLKLQLETAQNLSPHMKLDFAKMTVRTKTLQLMARAKKQENARLKEINININDNMRLLRLYTDDASQIILTRELEVLNHEKTQILESQSVVLADRAKTKWYNEGERSNKYFLNLLKRRTAQNEMAELVVEGQTTKDKNVIKAEVTSFYNTLYNMDMSQLHVGESFLDNMFTADPNEQQLLCAPLSLDELWQTLKPTRATTPGPDGMSNTYLKKLWDILGPLILDSWNYSLERGCLPPPIVNRYLG